MRAPVTIQSSCNVTSRLSCFKICSVAVVLAVFVLSRLASAKSAKDSAARAQAAALFAKALAVSDLRAPGSPPFEMAGTISIGENHGKHPTTGTYLLKWVSPDQWREEIHFANYTRIRVGGKNQYWQSRTTSYEVQPFLQLNEGLNFLKELHVWSNPANISSLESVKLHQKKDHGIKLNCVTLKPNEANASLDYCFNAVAGTLVSEIAGPFASESGPLGFSGFLSFGEKYFPGDIRAEAPPAVPVTLHVNSITPLAKTDVADFQPPAGSTSWPSCDAPDTLPIIESQVTPNYPVVAKMEHRDGSVFVYAIIGIDGRLSNLKLLSAPDGSLGASSLSAAEQWKYKPETCGGKPVPAETSIRTVYTLEE